MNLPFHSYRLRSKKAAQMRLLNCYAIEAPPEGKSPTMIQGMAGIAPFSTIADSPQRASIQFGGSLYSVAGSKFYRVAADGTATVIGTLSGNATVDLAKNQSQIAILIYPTLWVYNGTTLTEVTDPDFTSRKAKKMAVLDNFGGFIEPNSGRFFICDLADFTVYDALDFATAEGQPDNLVSIESNQRQFVLFGEESLELWDNAGGSGFPFLRVANGYVECGCGAADSTCTGDNTVFWLDQNRIFRRLEGVTPRRISNDGCEQQWQTYSRIDDANAYVYVFDGHTFIVLRFPSAGATWVHDINTGEWHERQSQGQDHWRAQWVVNCYGKTLVGDTQSGNIGALDVDTHTEWGNQLLREATTGVVSEGGRWINHDCLELDLEVGTGSEAGSDPQIMLEVSDDGGVTFRSRPNRSLGTIGQKRKRVRWFGGGRSRERVYRWRVSDDAPFVVNAARLDTR